MSISQSKAGTQRPLVLLMFPKFCCNRYLAGKFYKEVPTAGGGRQVGKKQEAIQDSLVICKTNEKKFK